MPKIPSAVGVAGGRRYRQNIDRQARRRPVIGEDRDKIGLQNGYFPTARLAQPRAAKFCRFVAVCLHQYRERNDVVLPGERYSD
jgi:hypothetical protein